MSISRTIILSCVGLLLVLIAGIAYVVLTVESPAPVLEPVPAAVNATSTSLVVTAPDPVPEDNKATDAYQNEFLNFSMSLPEDVRVDFTQGTIGIERIGFEKGDGGYFAYAAPNTNDLEGRDGFFGDLTKFIKSDDTLLEFCEQNSDTPCSLYTNPQGVRYTRLEGRFDMGDERATLYLIPLKASTPSWRLIAFSTGSLPHTEIKAMVDSFRYLR